MSLASIQSSFVPCDIGLAVAQELEPILPEPTRPYQSVPMADILKDRMYYRWDSLEMETRNLPELVKFVDAQVRRHRAERQQSARN